MLDAWRSYVSKMEGFQLRAQLLTGRLQEHAAAAQHSPLRRHMFETEVSTHDAAERRFTGSTNDIDAPYRERASAYMDFLVSKSVTGHFTTPSIADKAQVLVGHRSADTLPLPRYVGPAAGYEEYADIAQRWAEGKAGPCETCHEVVRASGRTFDKYGTSRPSYEQLAARSLPAPFAIDEPPNPFQLGSSAGIQGAATETRSFAPDVPLPNGIALPPPRTDLCGDLPPAEDSDRTPDLASWGPGSEIVASVIGRINAVLLPLGPRGYRVLGRQDFDALFKVSPDGMGRVQHGILARIDQKKAAFTKLRGDVQGGAVPYEELCPIVDELMPTTSRSTAALARQDVHRWQRKERILQVLELTLLALSVMVPPLAIATVPATIALGLVRVGLGVDQRRQGRQWQQGTGSGLYSLRQEAEAPGLAARGRSNIIAGTIEAGTSVFAFAQLVQQIRADQALFRLMESGTYELRHALHPGLVMRAQGGRLVLVDTQSRVILGYGTIKNGELTWTSMRVAVPSAGAGASARAGETALVPVGAAAAPRAAVQVPAGLARTASKPAVSATTASTRAPTAPPATSGSTQGTGGLVGPTLTEAPVALGGERHMLRLLQTPQGPVWAVCSGCKPVIDVLSDLRQTPGLRKPITDRLDAMIATVGRLASSRDPNVVRALLRTLSEADQLAGRGVLAQALARGGPPAVSGTASPEQIATRAAALEDVYYKQLWDARRPMFRGEAVRHTLDVELRSEARARAFVRAQSELRGTPLSLAPGAPARASVNASTDIPFGFFDRAGFDRFSRELRAALPPNAAGAELIMEGSGVSGRHFDRLIEHAPTGAPFDVGRISDYDIAIVSDDLLQLARARNLLESGARRTGALGPKELTELKLERLHAVAQVAARAMTGLPHPVHLAVVGSGSTGLLGLPLSR